MRGLNWYSFCRNVQQFSGHRGKIITFVEQENIKKCYVSVRWFALQLALLCNSCIKLAGLWLSLSLSLPFGHCKLTWNYHDIYFCWIWCIHIRVKYKFRYFYPPSLGGEIYWLGLSEQNSEIQGHQGEGF